MKSIDSMDAIVYTLYDIYYINISSYKIVKFGKKTKLNLKKMIIIWPKIS